MRAWAWVEAAGRGWRLKARPPPTGCQCLEARGLGRRGRATRSHAPAPGHTHQLRSRLPSCRGDMPLPASASCPCCFRPGLRLPSLPPQQQHVGSQHLTVRAQTPVNLRLTAPPTRRPAHPAGSAFLCAAPRCPPQICPSSAPSPPPSGPPAATRWAPRRLQWKARVAAMVVARRCGGATLTCQGPALTSPCFICASRRCACTAVPPEPPASLMALRRACVGGERGEQQEVGGQSGAQARLCGTRRHGTACTACRVLLPSGRQHAHRGPSIQARQTNVQMIKTNVQTTTHNVQTTYILRALHAALLCAHMPCPCAARNQVQAPIPIHNVHTMYGHSHLFCPLHAAQLLQGHAHVQPQLLAARLQRQRALVGGYAVLHEKQRGCEECVATNMRYKGRQVREAGRERAAWSRQGGAAAPARAHGWLGRRAKHELGWAASRFVRPVRARPACHSAALLPPPALPPPRTWCLPLIRLAACWRSQTGTSNGYLSKWVDVQYRQYPPPQHLFCPFPAQPFPSTCLQVSL